MELQFTKLNGLGNDFIFVDDFSREVELSEAEVIKLCDRHFGIGADGVILVRPSKRSECAAYMHYINSDGTLAQMCGNGVRCFAKYLVDRGFVDANAESFVADTLAGPKPIRFKTDENGKLLQASVDMGHPILDAAKVPLNMELCANQLDDNSYAINLPIESPWGKFDFTCVSMGNPHAVCFIKDWSALPDELFKTPEKSLETLNIDAIGSYYESNSAFPEKANIEFAEIVNDGINMRVYERGCGETLACGTGACATCVASVLAKGASRETDVHLKGGTLHIEWSEDDNNVYMTGPAKEAFEGCCDTNKL